MKSIKDIINESLLNEHANNAYKRLFGKDISVGAKVKQLFSSLGMDFRHEYDRFKVYEDGCIEYTNEKLFTGTICGKVRKVMINRHLGVDDPKFKVCDNALDARGSLDMHDNPKNYLRAVLNALTMEHYSIDSVGNVTITELDYTAGDFAKDSNKE